MSPSCRALEPFSDSGPGDQTRQHIFPGPRDQETRGEASILGVWVPNSPKKILLKTALFQGLALVGRRGVGAHSYPLHEANQLIACVLNICYVGNTKS